jgi:hypothetical protein
MPQNRLFNVTKIALIQFEQNHIYYMVFKRHFRNIEKFGLRALDPKEFPAEIKVIS